MKKFFKKLFRNKENINLKKKVDYQTLIYKNYQIIDEQDKNSILKINLIDENKVLVFSNCNVPKINICKTKGSKSEYLSFHSYVNQQLVILINNLDFKKPENIDLFKNFATVIQISHIYNKPFEIYYFENQKIYSFIYVDKITEIKKKFIFDK